jgi:hypothetical protein
MTDPIMVRNGNAIEVRERIVRCPACATIHGPRAVCRKK